MRKRRLRHSTPACIAGLAAGLALLACGEAENPTTTGGHAAHLGSAADNRTHPRVVRQGYLHGDRDDDDISGGPPDRDDRWVRMYGHQSSPQERVVASDVVRRYYAAASAQDGRSACSLASSSLARASDFVRFVPDEYRPARGSSVFRGKKCAEVADLLFAIDHQRLVEVSETVQVTSLRVRNNSGLAFLGFGSAGERSLPMTREGGAWKVDALLDDRLP